MSRVPIYFATRHSAHTVTQPELHIVDISYIDTPAMWAHEQYGTSAFSEETWAKRPSYISASTTMTPASHTRSFKITVESADVHNSYIQLSIIFASETREEVMRAMQSDVSGASKEAKDCGWTVREHWSSYKYGVYVPNCHASMSVKQTGECTWWDFWIWNMDNSRAEVETKRIPTRVEEEEREILGEKQWKRGVEKEEVLPSWEEMGLVKVEVDGDE